MVPPLFVVFGFNTKPLTMIRPFAELFGHYSTHDHDCRLSQPPDAQNRTSGVGEGSRGAIHAISSDRCLK